MNTPLTGYPYGRVLRGSFEYSDEMLRGLGLLLNTWGLGPRPLPSREALRGPVMSLRAYAPPGKGGPALLIVSSPIRPAYIWDLAPEVSVVRQCLRRGFQVYLIEWLTPGGPAQEYGLGDYAGRFISQCVETVLGESGQDQIFLAGHSLGGVCAAMHAARYPAPIRGVVLIASPLKAGLWAGSLTLMGLLSPWSNTLARTMNRAPGFMLDLIQNCCVPKSFTFEPLMDGVLSCCNSRLRANHWRVVRWQLDEMPLPRRLFEQIMGPLFLEDGFMRKRIKIGGEHVGPQKIQAPLVVIVSASIALMAEGRAEPRR